MRKLLLFFAMLSVSIGAWADDGNDADGYWLSFDSWYSNGSNAEVVTKINVSKPGGLAKALKAINDETYSSTKTVQSVTATYKTAKVVYIDTPSAYLNSDDLAALSQLDYETIDLQDAFYKESAEGEKKAFTFTNANVKNLILPDNWTKAEVNACAQAVAATSGSQLGSAYSQGVDGLTETSDVTRYYFKNGDEKGDEYTGNQQYKEGDNWYADVNAPVTRFLTPVPDAGNNVTQTYTNSWNNNIVETVTNTADVYEENGNNYIKPNPLNVKLKRYLYDNQNNDQSNNQTLGQDELGYYILVYDNNATTPVYQKRTAIYKKGDSEYYYDAEFTNPCLDTPVGNDTDGYYIINGYFYDQEYIQQCWAPANDNGDGTYYIQGGNVKQYLTETYKYQSQQTYQEVVYSGSTPNDNGDGTYTGSIENTTIAFQVKTMYNYSYTGLDGETTEYASLPQEQTQIQLDNYVPTELIAETKPETVVLGASLIAYVNKSNTLADALAHCFLDNKSNQKIGDISQNHFSCNKVKALTVSGNAVARDWSGAYSLAFTDGHMIFDRAADELSTSRDAGVGGVTRTLTGTSSSQGALYGASVIYLDLRSVKIDDQYCDDLNLTKATILTDKHNVEVWIPAEGSGLKTIPADFGTNQIVEMCIPSNIETIRTRAFPSVKHIWTTAGTETDKESWEDGYTKYDNGAVTETLADGTVSPTHTSSATSVVEHIGFKANQGDVTYGTYTFGSNLKLIESNAFTNSEPNVKDVYVLNTTAPECHVDAFNTAMYYGNNGYNASLISSEGIVTRDAYENHGRWITMLHYPKQTKAPDLQRYTDPTRKYSVATGDKDGNGATIYYPNHSEFGYAYAQGTTGYVWNAWDNSRTGSANAMNVNGHVTTGWNTTVQATSNANYASTKARENENWEYSAFYDVSVNGTDPNPAPTTYSSVYWSESAYELAGSQKDNTYVQLYDKDYRGWHQFVLNGYSANTTREVVFERSYIKDSDWWTICLPYDLTYSEMIKFFGTETQLPILSRLLYVTRDIEKEKITLNFSKNLMLYKDNMTLTADGIEDISSTSGSVAANDVVLHAGVPYVIKPYIPTSGSSELATRRFAIYKDTEEGLYNKLQAATELGGDELIRLVEDGLYTVPALVVNNTGVNAEAVEEGKTVPIGSTTYQVSSVYKYTMVGSLFNNQLPSYCYYLGWKWDNAAKTQGHACFWYNKKTGEANQKWAWTNNTCIICPNWPENLAVHKATSTADPARWIVGGDANKVDDDSYVASGSSQKARSNDILPEAETPVSSSATGISEIKNEEVVSGQNKVYDIDGRFVGNGTSGLTKGVYIVNGKKIIK